ncbi:hypothetical protein [Actinacidiphila oryziradicis]|nr:hypothetical protein [Actinacidiphila oryziradicis]
MDGKLASSERLPLCRLRFSGVLHTWGFTIYLASPLPVRPRSLRA